MWRPRSRFSSSAASAPATGAIAANVPGRSHARRNDIPAPLEMPVAKIRRESTGSVGPKESSSTRMKPTSSAPARSLDRRSSGGLSRPGRPRRSLVRGRGRRETGVLGDIRGRAPAPWKTGAEGKGSARLDGTAASAAGRTGGHLDVDRAPARAAADLGREGRSARHTRWRTSGRVIGVALGRREYEGGSPACRGLPPTLSRLPADPQPRGRDFSLGATIHTIGPDPEPV